MSLLFIGRRCTRAASFVRTRYIFAVMLLLVIGRGAVAAAPTEYQLKAAFLLNFAKFIDWPQAAFKEPRSPIVICVFGEDPFDRSIDEVVRGQTLGERPFAVKRVAQIQKDEPCHILFVRSVERERFERILGGVKNLPILTVGEDEEFARASGMINFIVENNKIRFEVNLETAERAGLKFSSRLLQLAKTVRGKRQ